MTALARLNCSRVGASHGILGGGALGLAAAYRLTQAGHSVMIFEQEATAGGLASGFRVGDNWLEKFYHHLFKTDTTAIKLIQELGLGDRLEWSHPRTVCLVNGKFQQLDSPLTLLRFSPLRIDERLRVAAVGAMLKLTNSKPYEGKTAEPWLRRWMGKRPYGMVFEPLFAAKFGDMHGQIALPWFWARFHDRTTYLGYLRGGFQLLYERLVERISQAGGKVLLGTRVETAQPLEDGRWEVRTNQGTWTFDRVLDRQMTDSYWINPCDPGYPFTSLVEHTNYRPPSEYGGRHLLYLGNYRPMHDPLFKMGKEEVIQLFLPHLQRINPAFRANWIQESWLFQAPFAQPIVTTEYRQHIPPLQTPLKGLWVANMFQVYPHDRGQNYSFELADRLVRELNLEAKA
ncbi:MAG: hypothetical protein E6J10_10830 [Chloroflexi bacterium]|nr:MAG: hypothetical protein E6J10_10830 [Chloroflexota bacterium]